MMKKKKHIPSWSQKATAQKPENRKKPTQKQWRSIISEPRKLPKNTCNIFPRNRTKYLTLWTQVVHHKKGPAGKKYIEEWRFQKKRKRYRDIQQNDCFSGGLTNWYSDCFEIRSCKEEKKVVIEEMGHQGDDEGVANNYNYYGGCKKASLEEVS